eukprot:CAMPEP_0172480490 /NCGR_PEP_ID=MMETSP1066-20121228/5655_1 /TAXON_ID=671091 /ORGANISM="Coscinodiscus wailesii, Strain CCMP2513" /LENGTH=127 /DNA_ID=CAMNT_0013241845 /DNA_START=98 /DNA_END=481 /DNA_ORIENTATION=+
MSPFSLLTRSPLLFTFITPQITRKTTNTGSFHTTTALSAKKYLLNYSYIPQVLEKRGPFREEHLALATELSRSGGPTGVVGEEVPTGALFVFDDEESAKEFASKDPYVANGIVTDWSVAEWNVVIGE